MIFPLPVFFYSDMNLNPFCWNLLTRNISENVTTFLSFFYSPNSIHGDIHIILHPAFFTILVSLIFYFWFYFIPLSDYLFRSSQYRYRLRHTIFPPFSTVHETHWHGTLWKYVFANVVIFCYFLLHFSLFISFLYYDGTSCRVKTSMLLKSCRSFS